ncbi:hypothetical protein [Actinosynnema sp. ALI-1.44]|uniref:hypothetical protein n=1 Tax=Actinosynnema sp. ALI-1.44 TaxID=1933779 RepID=UPI0011785C94|nr:hypothetical protein [Actinosynnema sp. ALI-1.44]
MTDPFRRARTREVSPQYWQNLVPPAFQLVTFAGIACYVEVLVAGGYGPVAALATAVTAAIGARISTASGRAAAR